MRVKLPPVLSIDDRTKGLGRVRQFLLSATTIDCQPIAFQKGRYHGHLLDTGDASYPLYLFRQPPIGANFDADDRVLIAKYDLTGVTELDVSEGQWLRHPIRTEALSRNGSPQSLARKSWRNAFTFVEEDPGEQRVGLRGPQIGALHAIHAHWSVSNEPATIVMPTGTGKTETMLSVLVSYDCQKVLVIVPTDALRSQIAGKFESLGVLKLPQCSILTRSAELPVVGMLTSRPKTAADVDSFFSRCNVVVTSAHLVGLCTGDVQARMADLCSHLFIDEAHHSEAATWKAFRAKFVDKTVLQFTATPFREDGKKVDGKIIYVYPLRKAQQEGYFKPIRFRKVYDFNPKLGDEKVAEAAIEELDKDTTKRHIVMARVDSTARADEVLAIYRKLGKYEVVAIHSGINQRDREVARERLLSGDVRIVVCVDMLGEGFDLPELKIAAFHDVRKSFAVTLQLAGRFTRVRQDLGDPVFITNTARIDVREELRRLYTQDPDWNLLLPDLTESAIDGEVVSQQFFQGFANSITEVPLKDIRPAGSMVVYKTKCADWKPENFRSGLRGIRALSSVFHSVNVEERTLVVMASSARAVRWTDVESISDWTWELYLAVWDPERSLLFIHGSNNSGWYRELAKALCGPEAELIIAPDIYRCFHEIKRLILNNVGLDEYLGRSVRYTGRMGSNVEARIGQAARKGAVKSVLAGQGYEKHRRASIGAAKRGRIWSVQRFRIDSFVAWAKGIGAKLIDKSINADEVLSGTLIPLAIGRFPEAAPIAVDWPSEILERAESGIQVRPLGRDSESLLSIDLESAGQAAADRNIIIVRGENWSCRLKLELFPLNDSFDFRFLHVGGSATTITFGGVTTKIEEYFTQSPPVIWFADGSSLEGCIHVTLPEHAISPFPLDRLDAKGFTWDGVDITKESQGDAKLQGTVQHRVISVLKGDPSFSVIFDDDGNGEAADVIAIALTEVQERKRIDVELYHCKYSQDATPGRRIEDLYEVCGQAQRSVRWLMTQQSRTGLFMHLLERDSLRTTKGRPSRFEAGGVPILGEIKDMSRYHEVSIRVHIVQPGLSKSKATHSQLQLLAVTERFLTDTYGVDLKVHCSP